MFVSKEVTFIKKLYRNPDSVSFEIDIDDEDTKNQQGNESDDEDYVSTVDNNSHNEFYGTKRLPWVGGELYGRASDEDEGGGNANEKVIVAKKTHAGRNLSKPKRYSEIVSLAFITAEMLCGCQDDEEPVSATDAVRRSDRLSCTI